MPVLEDIIEKYGNVINDGKVFIDKPRITIPFSPAMDIGLGGGIMEGSFVILTGPPKSGKAQNLSSIIWTPDGPKKMGDIKIGDIVCTENGGVAIVKAIYKQGIKPIYRITFADGDSCEACLDHLWNVSRCRIRNWKRTRLDYILTTQEILNEGVKLCDQHIWSVKLPNPVFFNSQPTTLDPYLLGVILGNGCITGTNGHLQITSDDKELIESLKQNLEENYIINTSKSVRYQHYLVNSIYKCNYNTYIRKLKAYKLWGCNSHTKFIPNEYKYNNVYTRLSILQGLLDTDGDIDKNGNISYTSVSIQLANDVKEIVNSLGGLCRIVPRITYKNNKPFKSFRLRIRFKNDIIPFRTSYKKIRHKNKIRTLQRYIEKIEYVGDEECQCIALDNPKGLYLTDSFIITHNTVSALHFSANCQQLGRTVYYLNIEGRLKARDLKGIKKLQPDKVKVIGSILGKILTGEEYLRIAEEIIRDEPGSVIIVDSVSQLCPEKELGSEIGDTGRNPSALLMASFCRKTSNIIPVNRNIVICITHQIANTSGFGAALNESGGRKIAYAVDVKLKAKKVEDWRAGAATTDPIGQLTYWESESTNTIAPGRKMQSYIRYGIGIDESAEIASLSINLGLIKKSGAWYKVDGIDGQFQGLEKLVIALDENKELSDKLNNQIRSMLIA
jgi:RecA/RadA recombinase